MSLSAIAALLVALGLLGWRFIEQERVLERQRVQDRLTYAADLAVDLLRRSLATTDGLLERLSATSDVSDGVEEAFDIQGNDAVVVLASPAGWQSSTSLLFYPDQPDRTDPAADAFAALERLELAGRELTLALDRLDDMAHSSDVRIRAGALMRYARVAHRLGKTPAALDAYDRLSRLGPVPAAGRPADLVAMFQSCTLFDERADSGELGRVAAELDDALKAGRWRLSRGEYDFYRSRTRHWIGVAREDAADVESTEALSAALAAWSDEPAIDRDIKGVRTDHSSAVPVAIAWHREGDRVAAIAATPAYVARVWMRELSSVENSQRASVTLTTATGVAWMGGGGDTGEQIARAAADTGLPFGLRVSSADPAGDAVAFAGRRRLQAGLLVTLGLLLVAGGYVVARSVGRELEAARLQSDFVSAVSHEFRTPVASIRQLSELLDEGRVDDAGRRAQYYGLLRRESERLHRLVENLLDFGRMESAAREYRFEDVDPRALVEDVVADFAGAAARGEHGVTVTTPHGLPILRVDREAIGRALWNLLDNAAKYSPAGTTIDISVTQTDNGVSIRVRDQGPGMPRDEHERVFEPFVRGSSAQASRAKGTGLGLAMVAHIVRAHGGRVRVESEPGAGSLFTIELPATSASLQAAAHSGLPASPAEPR